MGKKIIAMKIRLLTDAPRHNLAIMKLSAWHKTQGDTVSMSEFDQADYRYASILFERNKNLFFADEYGGPDKEENIIPDNSFFFALLNCSIPRICVENPVPSKVSKLPPYSQIIQPWYFGHDHSKKTCLWLKNLPLLISTEIIKITHITTATGHKYTAGWYRMPRTSIARSRTFQGIANAMAEQWG